MTTTGAPFQPAPGGGPNLPTLPPALPGNQPDAGVSPLGADSSSGGIGGLLRTLKRRQGIFIASTALISGLLAAQTFIERRFNPVFAGNFTLQIESSLFDDQVLGAEGKIATLARSRVRNNIPALSAILSSPLVIAPVAEKMGLQTSDIVSRLNIQSNPNTQAIMNVSLNWKNPEQGRAILENLAKAFVEYSLLQRQSSIDSGMKWLDTQAPSILANVNKYETKLREFREKNLVIDPTENAETIITQRDALVNQVSSLQLEQARLQSQIETVRSGKLSYRPSGAPAPIEQLGRQGTLIPSTASPSGQVLEETVGTTNPSSEYQKYEIELARARAVYRDDSPVVQSILAKRDALAPVAKNQQLGQLTEKLFENVKRQDELNRQILMLNQNFRSSPDKLKEYNNIAQRLEAARTNYASYVSALENFKLEKARFVSPWQVISPPSFNDVPVSPDIRNNLLRALLFGLVGGTIAAVIRERTDNVFHTPTDAEKELQLPVLGLVPYLPLEPGLNIGKSISNMTASERFAIKESLRSLFTTFRLLRADRDIKLVGVTSSTQGEGKSTAISIFARTLADLGLKVLVVDADMRLPTQAKYLGVASGGDGFSTLLTDPKSNFDSVTINVQENFDFIPSGPKPPDPAKLLNSSRCQDVVQMIRNHSDYDIVLFDTPPCLMLADPILLGEKLDGILFLVGLGKVSRRLAPQASRRIKATGVDVLGMICNQVSFPTNLNDYGYEYGYYYHYGYTYSDSYKQKGINSYFNKAKNSYFSNRYIQQGAALPSSEPSNDNFIDSSINSSEGNKDPKKD
ncbi:MAG: GumC family protein [Cyanobacteriota bacterium]